MIRKCCSKIDNVTYIPFSEGFSCFLFLVGPVFSTLENKNHIGSFQWDESCVLKTFKEIDAFSPHIISSHSPKLILSSPFSEKSSAVIPLSKRLFHFASSSLLIPIRCSLFPYASSATLLIYSRFAAIRSSLSFCHEALNENILFRSAFQRSKRIKKTQRVNIKRERCFLLKQLVTSM